MMTFHFHFQFPKFCFVTFEEMSKAKLNKLRHRDDEGQAICTSSMAAFLPFFLLYSQNICYLSCHDDERKKNPG